MKTELLHQWPKHILDVVNKNHPSPTPAPQAQRHNVAFVNAGEHQSPAAPPEQDFFARLAGEVASGKFAEAYAQGIAGDSLPNSKPSLLARLASKLWKLIRAATKGNMDADPRVEIEMVRGCLVGGAHVPAGAKLRVPIRTYRELYSARRCKFVKGVGLPKPTPAFALRAEDILFQPGQPK